jgi:hypothetical protein
VDQCALGRKVYITVLYKWARNNLSIGMPIEYVTLRQSLPFIEGAPPHARLVALV